MADSRTTGTRYADHEDHFRTHHRDTYGGEGGQGYAHYEPAYRSGLRHGTSSDYEGRSFGDVEPEMRRRHEKEHGEGSWNDVRGAARHAFDRGRSQLERQQPGEEKADAGSMSGSSASASGDPGSIMREGDREAVGDDNSDRRRDT